MLVDKIACEVVRRTVEKALEYETPFANTAVIPMATATAESSTAIPYGTHRVTAE